jgi:DNA-binding NarL/FixJ family response regulator
MPGPGAYRLEKWVRENYPETTVLVLTAHNRDAYLAKLIDSGVAGFLLKNESADQLILAIRRVTEGTLGFTEEQIKRAQKWRQDIERKWKSLSPREQEVLKQIALGKENKIIADSLTISLKTVEFHMTHILKKLNLNSRDEAIVWMLTHRPDNLSL